MKLPFEAPTISFTSASSATVVARDTDTSNKAATEQAIYGILLAVAFLVAVSCVAFAVVWFCRGGRTLAKRRPTGHSVHATLVETGVLRTPPWRKNPPSRIARPKLKSYECLPQYTPMDIPPDYVANPAVEHMATRRDSPKDLVSGWRSGGILAAPASVLIAGS